jgi:muramoyltetrapeptide carboxypeptidase
MLMQLKLAGKFEGVRGIVFGEMLDCTQNSQQGYRLEEVVMRICGHLGVPVAYGMRSGHVTRRNITLPIGVSASFEVAENAARLRITEAAVSVK